MIVPIVCLAVLALGSLVACARSERAISAVPA
jgi:hypothetical protein